MQKLLPPKRRNVNVTYKRITQIIMAKANLANHILENREINIPGVNESIIQIITFRLLGESK